MGKARRRKRERKLNPMLDLPAEVRSLVEKGQLAVRKNPDDQKISASLVELVEPYLEEVETRQQFELIAGLGVLAWNIASSPPGEGEALYREAVGKLQAPETELAEELIQELVEQKLLLFPDDRRIVVSWDVRKVGDQFILRAASLSGDPAGPIAPGDAESGVRARFGRILPAHSRTTTLRIPVVRIALTAVAIEAVAIGALFAIVALFGPHDATAAQAFAERLGVWFGPLSGAVLCLGGGYWAAKDLPSTYLLNGALLGVVAASLDIGILVASGTPFQPVFVVSNLGRIAAGLLGGWLASRSVKSSTWLAGRAESLRQARAESSSGGRVDRR